MMTCVQSAALSGIHPILVRVEVDVRSIGLPYTKIVGLPNRVVEESKERVRTALINSGFRLQSRKTTINLTPTSVPKTSASLDLPIAIALLQSYAKIPPVPQHTLLFGELSLDGSISPVKGALAFVHVAKQNNMRICIIPEKNLDEVSFSNLLPVVPVRSLSDCVVILKKNYESIASIFVEKKRSVQQKQMIQPPPESVFAYPGNTMEKRILEIAAAGNHHVLLFGPPGTGKSFLAQSINAILPSQTTAEMIEVTKQYSIAGLLDSYRPINARPFRVVDARISPTQLLGQHTQRFLGEIYLAQSGVLFFDELQDATTETFSAIRTAISTVYTSSAHEQKITLPYPFLFIGAMNACRCGNAYSKQQRCNCTASDIRRFWKRIPASLLDRVDMHVLVNQDFGEIRHDPFIDTNHIQKEWENSCFRVQRCRNTQENRLAIFQKETGQSFPSGQQLVDFCQTEESAFQLLERAATAFHFTYRRLWMTLRIARTIADLSDEKMVKTEHVSEALHLRNTTAGVETTKDV